jgi:hypothetical protein
MLFGSWQTGAVERDEAQKLMVLLDFLHFASKHPGVSAFQLHRIPAL